MRSIVRYELPARGTTKLYPPEGTEFIQALAQGPFTLVLFGLVQSEAKGTHVAREIHIVPTGFDELPDDSETVEHRYLGTALLRDGAFPVHVFERIEHPAQVEEPQK